MVNWDPYLASIRDSYAQWWQVYTLTDVEGRKRKPQQPTPVLFNFNLMVQTIKSEQPQRDENPEEDKNREEIERLPVLEGLRKYAADHVLLVGRPGSGKSTALVRLLGDDGIPDKIPVLVELRYYQTSVLELVRNFLKRHDVLLDSTDIERLLFEGQFWLLIDGVNELPSEAARVDLTQFRRDYQKHTPMIFTTRDLGVGGDLGIEKKLEMQPLSAEQMSEFVRKYLPQQGEQMLQQLGDRLREFGQTPLLLWMLCSLFQDHGEIPSNLGLVFRKFTKLYSKEIKHDVRVSEESREFWPELLQQLGFVMTTGDKPKEITVAIPKTKAQEILTDYLRQNACLDPKVRARAWLKDLLNHHLIQQSGDLIEFRHQLIQEYYTAEYLLKQLPGISDQELQQNYLNYLKWTEPLVLMLQLVNDQAQAQRVVRLGLEVDWQLGARLAGAVKPEFQEQTVGLVAGLKVPTLLKLQLLGITESDKAIPELSKCLDNNQSSSVRSSAAEALVKIGTEATIDPLIKLLDDQDYSVRSIPADALVKIGTETTIPKLINLLNKEEFAATHNQDIFQTIMNVLNAIQERYKYNRIDNSKPNPPKPNPPKFIATQTIYILHLSDLHITTSEQATLWSNQLAQDLIQDLLIPNLDALILSGDIANYSTPEEYQAAQQFLHNLRQDFPLDPKQIVLVPGNHDLNWKLAKRGYQLLDLEDYDGELKEGYYIEESPRVIRVRDEAKYQQRFAHFSQFYEAIKTEPYPLDYDQQAIIDHFPDQNLLILGLNSAWQLDHHFKDRASIHSGALSNALTEIRRNPDYRNCLKLAVWHHALNSAGRVRVAALSEHRITDQGFIQQLAVAGFRFFLHGHIHKAETSLFRYDLSPTGRKLDQIGAGTFGAPTRELIPGYPWQYNLLKVKDNQLTVYTRRREEKNGAWKPDSRWTQGAGVGALDYYSIEL